MGTKLTGDEKEILNSYENEEWQSVKSNKTVEKYRSVAKATTKKDKRGNNRICY